MNKLKRFITHISSPVLLVASASLLLVIFLSTTPSDKSFTFTLVPLILIWVFVFSLIMIFQFFIHSTRKAILRSTAATIASVVMLLVMFSALGQLSFFDAALLVGLAALGSFYFRRSWPN